MDDEEFAARLVDKSTEAFILGLEVFNKPTIRYRIEGFAFFVCNAWELMLKAKLIKDGRSVYYKKSPDRTLSLRDVLGLIYTDKNQPLRKNLEQILTLRNTSTHFITEDYETVYAPLFQACVLNYSTELERFHHVDITAKVAHNFLTLSASIEPLTNEQVRVKYPPEVAMRLIFQKNDIEITTGNASSSSFAIPIKHNLYVTKKKGEADLQVKIGKEGDPSVSIVKQLANPAETHKFSFTNLVTEINKRLASQHIPFSYEKSGARCSTFTTYCLNLFVQYYNMKTSQLYAFEHVVGNATQYTYSQQAAEFIVSEIKKSPLEGYWPKCVLCLAGNALS